MKKKVLSILLASAMVVSAFSVSAFAEETEETDAAEEATTDMSVLEGLTVGFAQCDNKNSWRIAETESLEEVAEAYGVNFIYTDAGADIAKQASDIEDLVSQGVDYLVVAPQEEDGLQSAIASAMDAGIPVILVDRSINGTAGEDYTMAIMSDFIWEAEQCANVIIEDGGGSGNVVILEGTQGATSTIDRQSGFMDAIADTDLEVIADQVGDYVMDTAQEVMENILQAQGDDIDYVYSHNDDMVQGAIAAIKAAGYTPGEDIKLVGIDGPKAAMQSILDGEQLASCSCSPLFGPITFDSIAKLQAGEDVPLEITNEDTLYTIDNASLDEGF